jgi:hypothetical protein
MATLQTPVNAAGVEREVEDELVLLRYADDEQ